MEIILAIVVASAVIFFGALISMGNERQKRAIDSLREQVVLWAIQDMRIKRENFGHDVHVDDPLGWFNKVLSRVCGYDLNLQEIEVLENPYALVCASPNGEEKIILSPLSPNSFRKLIGKRQSRLFHSAEQMLLLTMMRSSMIYEITVLNGGIMFDFELQIAWKALTGQNAHQMERIWVFKSKNNRLK